jgi:hypothetical protein
MQFKLCTIDCTKLLGKALNYNTILALFNKISAFQLLNIYKRPEKKELEQGK